MDKTPAPPLNPAFGPAIHEIIRNQWRDHNDPFPRAGKRATIDFSQWRGVAVAVQLPCRAGKDPMLDTLRNIYGAHPIRVPDSQVEVLTILAAQGKNPINLRGALEPLINAPFEVPSHLVATSELADVSNLSSSSLKISVGLKILESFATALGLSGALPILEASFSSTKKIRFSFKQMTHSFVDINVLARLLNGRRIVHNTTTTIFLDPSTPADFLLVDSVLQSTSFGMEIERNTSGTAELNLSAIQKTIDEISTEVELERTSDRTVAFSGPNALTFAFTCKLVDLGEDKTIVSFDENRQSRFLSAQNDIGTGQAVERSYVAELVPASPAPLNAMIDFNFGE